MRPTSKSEIAHIKKGDWNEEADEKNSKKG